MWHCVKVLQPKDLQTSICRKSALFGGGALILLGLETDVWEVRILKGLAGLWEARSSAKRCRLGGEMSWRGWF
jgi:hypothetical protein